MKNINFKSISIVFVTIILIGGAIFYQECR